MISYKIIYKVEPNRNIMKEIYRIISNDLGGHYEHRHKNKNELLQKPEDKEAREESWS